ncbi:hypothetical protein BGX26_011934 [Mortierella sp. AD094]|nr:hypothetical protein BGX26_011934 [Mortierella sp. AD094]
MIHIDFDSEENVLAASDDKNPYTLTEEAFEELFEMDKCYDNEILYAITRGDFEERFEMDKCYDNEIPYVVTREDFEERFNMDKCYDNDIPYNITREDFETIALFNLPNIQFPSTEKARDEQHSQNRDEMAVVLEVCSKLKEVKLSKNFCSAVSDKHFESSNLCADAASHEELKWHDNEDPDTLSDDIEQGSWLRLEKL